MVKLQRILCGIDFSDCSRHAFDQAVAVARTEHAALTVLHVAPSGPQFDARRIESEMERFLEIDPARGVEINWVAWEATHVDDEILAEAKRRAVDLIVVGTHGRSGVQRLMLGSIAEKVLRKAEPPVLTVPPASVRPSSSRQAAFERILCAIDFSEWSLAGLRYAVSLAERHDARLGVCHVIDLIAPIYDPIVGLALRPAGVGACRTRLSHRRRNRHARAAAQPAGA